MTLSDEERKARRKEYERKRAQDPKRKAAAKKRAQDPKRKAAAKKRAQSPEGKLRQKKRDASPAKRAYNRKREKTPERKKYKKQLHRNIKFTTFSVYSKRHSNSDIPCCRCCGENSDIRFLAMDHINGRAHLPEEEKNLFDVPLAMWLKKNNYPEGEIQILCHNCNSAKGNSKDNKCPHQR
jgi:hypothetical protein